MKMKKIIWLMILIAITMIPSVLSYTQVQYSPDNLTWKDAINVTSNSVTLETLEDGINDSTQYYFRIRHTFESGNSNWIYINTKTDTELNDMTLALIIGILGIAFTLIYFSFNLGNDHFLLKLLFIFIGLSAMIYIPATVITGADIVSKDFMSVPLWAFRIFVIYFSVYLFYHWTKSSRTIKRWFGRN